MKKFTFKRQLLFVMLMLLGCLSIQAADDGLITNQVVINLDEPGTLPQKISASDKYLITNLKVKGDINGTDLGFLREMAGQSINGIDETNGKLSTLDLSDTKIVGGGEPYFNYGGYETYFTEYNKIGKYAFCSCNNLKRLTLPKDITSIEQSAFFGCSGLTSITIPSSVTAIGKWSFYDCSSLTSIELPNSTTTIDEAAFQNCTSLASVTLTSNLTSIESHAFIGCSQLKDVRYNVLDDLATYIQTDHPEIVIGNNCNCDFKYYQNNQEITSLKIPAGITSIGKNVFQKYNGIQSLTFSPALTSISDLQFSCDFTNLKSVYAGWQDPIAAGTFFKGADMSNCTLYVPHGTTNAYANSDIWCGFGKIIEYNNQATITLEQPGTLPQKINDSDKNLITHLKIKGNINGTDLRFIREMAGVSVTGEITDGELANLDLSEAKIVSGGDYYYQDSNDTKYYTKDDELGVCAFSKCRGLKDISLPGDLKSVGDFAFSDCSSLETINLPSGITTIGNYAFWYCENLTSLTLPSGLISIGDRAFENCYSLTSLEFPSSLTTLGELVFAGCYELSNLTLHSNLTDVKSNYLFGGASNYNNLKDVRYIIDSDLETYLQSNHPIFYEINCGIKYYLNDQEITTLEIPSGITSIGDGVFLSNKSLTNLTLSSKVSSIGISAFYYCDNLKDVRYYIYDDLATYIQNGHPDFYVGGIKYYWNDQEITTLEIPTSVTSIGNNAFYGCSGLTTLNLPSNVTSIGDRAFGYCSNLTSVDLPSSITKMGDFVFFYCEKLSNVNLPSDITTISTGAFGGCSSLQNINLPSGVTTIGDNAFSDCSNLTNVTLPSALASIGDYAFSGCSNLTNVILPSAFTAIGNVAFSGCSNLANVTLSSNITSIGTYAFQNCINLKNLTISKDVTSIKDIAFNNSYDDLELESVYVAWENPIEAGSFFDRINISNCTLYVPQGTKEAYANADVWKDFGNIIEYDATGIDKVTNRSDVKEISRYSLNGQRVTSPTKGVNIVVYSDGSIKKVAVQ